jgi:hypothetical protein
MIQPRKNQFPLRVLSLLINLSSVGNHRCWSPLFFHVSGFAPMKLVKDETSPKILSYSIYNDIGILDC